MANNLSYHATATYDCGTIETARIKLRFSCSFLDNRLLLIFSLDEKTKSFYYAFRSTLTGQYTIQTTRRPAPALFSVEH